MLRVATWNQNGWDRGQEAKRAALLEAHKVDLLCAQELNYSRFAALLMALGDDWWGVCSLTARPGLPPPSSYWGVAIFGRSAAVVVDGAPEVIGDPDDESGTGLFWRRTVTVPVRAAGVRFTVASVHVRPGAVVGEQKLEFVSRLGRWMTDGPRPLMLGADANSPGVQEDGREHYWGVEEAVWGPAASHGLRDVWRYTDQPMSPTHVLRGGRGVRFDHLWVSDTLKALTYQALLQEARTVGSDHALVVADVELPGVQV